MLHSSTHWGYRSRYSARFRLLAYSTEPMGRRVEASPPRAMRLLAICKAIQALHSKSSRPIVRFMPHRRLGFATIAMCTILLFARIPIVLMIIAAEAPQKQRQNLSRFFWKLIDEEMTPRKGGLSDVHAPFTPFIGDVEQAGHLSS